MSIGGLLSIPSKRSANIERIYGSRTSKEIGNIERLIPTHQYVQMDVTLGQNGHVRILCIGRSAGANHERNQRAFATIFLSIMSCNGKETPYKLRMSVSFRLSCVSAHLTVSACEIGQGGVSHVLEAVLDRTVGLKFVDHAARSVL
jgi:hypothetical protein